MSINWNNIRTLQNSQNEGFEELVCQLASQEIIEGQKKFWRIGKPDGGKECIWELKDGTICAWQAKFFTTIPASGQWAQINDSVKTTIDNHSNLVKYFIAIPANFPDGKSKEKISFLSKWKAKVIEWQNYAASKGLTVEFEFWGSFELLQRLAIKRNEGLKYFWFNQEELSDQWLDYINLQGINALGSRYTAELNFELEIGEVFNGLARNALLVKKSDSAFSKLIESFRLLQSFDPDDGKVSLMNSIFEKMQEFQKVYQSLSWHGVDILPFDKLIDILTAVRSECYTMIGMIYDLGLTKPDAAPKPGGKRSHDPNEVRQFEKLLSGVHEMISVFEDSACILANHPFALITGKAGIGKSHLLADIVQKRKQEGRNSLLLLGENFRSKELPWTQILSNHLHKTQIDELFFLGALNAKAESEGQRIIVFIDAINEGEGRVVWPKHLKSFIESFFSFPWLGLVISIRNSYLPLIAPIEKITEDLIYRIEHVGFEGAEFEASKLFFEHYKIIQPSSPFLNPEFQNPLFLKLFCLSLFERGLHEVPPGYEGITTIIDYFLDSINIKLSLPDELYFDERKMLVRQAVEGILKYMVEKDQVYVPYDDADKIVDDVFKGNCSNPEPFLKRLISEGVFNIDLFWSGPGKHQDVIHFAYQRFQDHLTVSMLLDLQLDPDKPAEAFKTGRLFNITENEESIEYHQNLIEALSIQLPERTGLELYEIIPHAKFYVSIAASYIESLIWRRNESIGEGAKSYVNEVIVQHDDLFSRFLETTISASMKPGFYFNADRLHEYLMRFSLAERDASWTTWLQNKYGEKRYKNSVKTLIDWGWHSENKVYISNEAAHLGGVALSWFLTSSNRYLRDSATKALVSLFQDRVHLLVPLLEKFKDVNDPYIRERQYAVAYGCAVRSADKSKLGLLAAYSFKSIFDKKEVYPNILLRDYARGIIEYAVYNRINLNFDPGRARPPYRSKPFPKTLPSNITIDKKYQPNDKEGDYGKKRWGATAILKSMTTEYGRKNSGYGDFGRYTFQSALYDWRVDPNKLSNYAVQRIFEMGYDPLVFSSFDSRQGSGRGSGHLERIGKKYQWIAFYEILARVSDHFKLVDDSDWDRKKTIAYDGPWHPYVRDIDPTMLIRETRKEQYQSYSEHWYNMPGYNNWNIEDQTWIADNSDLPDPSKIINVKDPKNKDWLWLEVHPDWSQRTPPGEDRYNSPKKRLFYQIRSYLIKQEEIENFKTGFNEDFYRGDLPESRSRYEMFSREYYWSPSYFFFNKSVLNGLPWIDVYNKKTKDYIGDVLRTTEQLNWEEEFDCSKEEAIQFFKPSYTVYNGLGLQLSQKEGEFLDPSGKETICMDPSVNQNSISGLLVRKDKLVEWLEKEKLAIFWCVLGEKQISTFRSGYPSRQNISGLFMLEQGQIKGSLHFASE